MDCARPRSPPPRQNSAWAIRHPSLNRTSLSSATTDALSASNSIVACNGQRRASLTAATGSGFRRRLAASPIAIPSRRSSTKAAAATEPAKPVAVPKVEQTCALQNAAQAAVATAGLGKPACRAIRRREVRWRLWQQHARRHAQVPATRATSPTRDRPLPSGRAGRSGLTMARAAMFERSRSLRRSASDTYRSVMLRAAEASRCIRAETPARACGASVLRRPSA